MVLLHQLAWLKVNHSKKFHSKLFLGEEKSIFDRTNNAALCFKVSEEKRKQSKELNYFYSVKDTSIMLKSKVCSVSPNREVLK